MFGWAKSLTTAITNRLTRDTRYLWPGRLLPARPASGVRVTADTSLQSATVWACHRYLTQTIGQLPVRVMRERGDLSEPVRNHPVGNVFAWRANPELAPFQLKETLTGWAVLRGNGIAEIERDAVGRVVALWPIHPDRVTFLRDVDTDALIYRISNGPNGTVDLRPDQVFHLRGFGNGPVGLSVVEHAAESLGWARATEIFGAAFFGNGLNTSGVIEGAGALQEAGQKKLRAQIEQRHGGPQRSHVPLFLDKAMKWVSTSTKPNDAQFIETMQHQVEEICRWFGCPPQKVGHLLRMTFNNVEQLSIEVVQDSITPWAIRWEEEANFKLFGQNRQGFFIKLDLKGLLRGDFKSRQEGLQIMRLNGVINANDWCELEDMKKLPDRLGQKYVVPANMTTLDRLGEDQTSAANRPEPAVNDNPPAAATLRNIGSLRRIGEVFLNAA
jgi:HK97 family phage portal protein